MGSLILEKDVLQMLEKLDLLDKLINCSKIVTSGNDALFQVSLLVGVSPYHINKQRNFGSVFVNEKSSNELTKSM
ncbi:Uncharacterized protein APZ42_033344 [Daphnia magna]|nr:Uncharacterized protein APZ42_033344 [Daphnia magna]